MKKLIYTGFIFSLGLFLLIQCKEAPNWADPADNIPPGSVSNIVVENIHGGAVITYNLPSDNDILGVKAVYSINEDGDEVLESFSSAFKDTIKLEGFPDTNERTVQLITIDKSRNESEPVSTVVQPLIPPVELIRQSLVVKKDFGGLVVSWDNTYGENIGISLYAADSTQEMVFDHTLYTSDTEGTYAFRGYDATERAFELQIRDRWGNYSAPLDTLLTPLFEEQIMGQDENGVAIWKRFGWDDQTVFWRGDVNTNKYVIPERGFEKLFDGSYHVKKNAWHPGEPGVTIEQFIPDPENPDGKTLMEPYYWTLDLGRSCLLNRHKHYFPGGVEQVGQRHYEIWATNEEPKGRADFNSQLESLAYWTCWPEANGTDAWKNDWDHIATCDFVMPSGATKDFEWTDDDLTWAKNNGFEFEIDRKYSNTPYRYLRFECQKTYGGTTINRIGEIEFFGVSLNE